MESYIKAQPETGNRSSNLIIVTGPSRTADITQTLTLGVHGPGTLHIIMLVTYSCKHITFVYGISC
ncbi:MAG: hypothetical protein CM1200mP6_09410 [Anaerolineaceae bacterium]|nr:MAG: hypothetical protein CM1200mP6_09410 [Anaerolineaceae bacterium]